MLPGSLSDSPTFCLWPDYLSALPSGYCSPIVDHTRLLDYSSALLHLYLFAICSTLTVLLTMSSNKSLQMYSHASHLVGSFTEYSATRGSSGFSMEPWPGMDPFDQLLDLRQGSSAIEVYVILWDIWQGTFWWVFFKRHFSFQTKWARKVMVTWGKIKC